MQFSHSKLKSGAEYKNLFFSQLCQNCFPGATNGFCEQILPDYISALICIASLSSVLYMIQQTSLRLLEKANGLTQCTLK